MLCTQTLKPSHRHAGDASTAVQSLVYAQGGLCLIGIACLWLLMNQSANFAHARRDLRSERRRHSSDDDQVCGEA